MSLTAGDYPLFFRAVYGYKPFPWQTRLVHQIVDERAGCWPALLTLPTGSGKTSVIDIAIFLLGLDVEKGRPKPVTVRRAAIRTFFVVDRRIVVDEAGEKARKLARLLNTAGDDQAVDARLQEVARKVREMKPEHPDPLSSDELRIIKEIAQRLCAFGGGKALHVSVLRGGMYRDGSWAHTPNQPTICLSTVDQVGSRLLFRGYGVSKNQFAVHAGLVGNDSLIIVDEAHLSQPFRDTLEAVEFYRGERWAERPFVTPFQTVFMSATVADAAEPVAAPDTKEAPGPEVRPFGLENDRYGNDYEDPVLKPRLEASKLARLELLKDEHEDERKNRQAFAAELVRVANDLATVGTVAEPPRKGRGRRAEREEPPTPTLTVQVVGIVVNRVDTARRVFDLLRAGLDPEAPEYDVILLTGRIRPYDRDELLWRKQIGEQRGWFPFIKAKKDRPAPPHGKLFVVATQTIEVGADISFDALITEAAPLDALRQRFGRLDRLGLRKVSHGVIAARKHLLKEEDPIYGDAIKMTWEWLGRQTSGTGRNKRVDFGLLALIPPTDPVELATLCARTVRAPVMMPAHLDNWVQTTVPPMPDPDPALFLHGPEPGSADVNLVWRADLTANLLKEKDAAVDVVALVPPTSMEALPVPVWAVKRWLKDEHPSDVPDLEAARDPQFNQPKSWGKLCVRWCGPDDDETGVIFPDAIGPGDTIVVPSQYGGADEYGWKPDAADPVADVSDDCSWRAKRKPVLRVHQPSDVHRRLFLDTNNRPPVWGNYLSGEIREEIVRRVEKLLAEPETSNTVWSGLQLPEKFRWLKTARHIPYPDDSSAVGNGVVFVGRGGELHPCESSADDGNADEPPPAGDASSQTGERVTLAAHCCGVQTRVRELVHSLGLPGSFCELLARAALLHDAGKADERFRLYLHGGDESKWAADPTPLAKSGRLFGQNRAADRAARRKARWPKGARHEALSVLMVQQTTSVRDRINDAELLDYIIGAHHGRGRPLWPVELNNDLPKDTDPERDKPSEVTCRLGDFDLKTAGVFRPELALARLDAGWADLFWRMVRRYGYWGLAYLEALLILADHQQSETEKEGTKP